MHPDEFRMTMSSPQTLNLNERKPPVSPRLVSQVIALLAAVAAVFAFLPYSWSHLTAGAITVLIGSYHGAPTVLYAASNVLTKSPPKG